VVYLKDLHGDLVMNDGKISDLKTTIQNTNTLPVINDMILTLHREGYNGIDQVLRRFLADLGFDRVVIYYGDGYPKLFCREKVKSACEYAFFAENRDYIAAFNDDGVLAFPTIHRLQEMDLNIYHVYNSQHTENFIQILLGTKDNIRGFLSLECCHLEKKRSENMINYIHIVAHLLAAILEENNT